MRTLQPILICLVVVSLVFSSALYASADESKEAPAVNEAAAGKAVADKDAADKDAGKKADDSVVESTHQLQIDGAILHYRARAGELLVENGASKAKGRFFFVAYELLDAQGKKSSAQRPLTFAFNGGPGASSAWLHLGCMGPERLAMGANGEILPPPSRLITNEQTWLPFTDLVFIDPVGTGYSRAQAPEGKDKKGAPDNKAFWGVKQDVSSVAEFIRLYLTRYQRWSSPKFLAGESYGTTRAAALSRYLMDRQGIALNGVTLMSPVLAFETVWGGGILPPVLMLPTYAATARAHGLGAHSKEDVQKVVQEAEAYASGPYLNAVFQGTALSREDQDARDKQIAGWTGLPLEEVQRQDGEIPTVFFLKNLLRKDGLMLSRYDGTISGIDPVPENPFHMEYDPNLDLMSTAMTEVANAYYRENLNYENSEPYEMLSIDVNRSWDWSSGLHGGQGYINTADDLAVALAANPALHVFIGGGYYDMATPCFATAYTVNHMGLAPSVRQRVDLRNYEGGHMFYTHEDALKQFTADIRKFYGQALGTNSSGKQ